MGFRNTLFSLYGWTVWILHLLLAGPVLLLAISLSPPRAFGLVKLFCRSAFACVGIRVVTRGLEHLDPTQQYLFMGNHPSMIDPFIAAIAIPRFAVGIEKASNFRIPIYGRLITRWGNLPIHKDDPVRAREAIAAATERFRQGFSVVILPEGTRSKDGRIGPFKKGGFHLALDTQAEIAPFTIIGAFQAFPAGGWRIHPATIEVVFGKPLPTRDFARQDLEALLAETRRRIAAPYPAPDDSMASA